MKKKLFPLLILSISYTWQLNAQNNSILLTKGEKWVVKSKDSNDTKQIRAGEEMPMKTYTTAMSEYQVLEANPESYMLTHTIKKISVQFDGFGMKMEYDSEDPSKQSEMMKEQMKGLVGKVDTIYLTLDGKLIDTEEGTQSKKGKKGGAGGGRGMGNMMRMMEQGGSNPENLFVSIPKGIKEGEGWKSDKTKDGVKSQTIYFVEKINGNSIELSFKKKTKGVRSFTTQQGESNIDIDNLSSGNIVVDATNGKVKNYTEKVDTKSKMNMMGMDMTTNGSTASYLDVSSNQ